MYIMTSVFPPPGNPAIIKLFTKPVFIKSKYEFIDSTPTLITNCCYTYEASVFVEVFLKLTTGSQSKGSSIVSLSNSSRGGTWHLMYASHKLMLGLYHFLLFLNYSKTLSCLRSRAKS